MEIKDKVDVYWNINRRCFSIKSCSTGRVVGYTDAINLVKAQFIVREAGRQRVLREQQKNVHAFVRGYITQASLASADRQAKYNPYKNDKFVDKQTGQPIESADAVELFTNDNGKGDIKYT